MSKKHSAFINAQLIDPSAGTQTHGGLLVKGDMILDLGAHITAENLPDGTDIIDCDGACLTTGLVDMRVLVGEPGFEHKETFATACDAAVTGGITAMAILPETDPITDNVANIEFVARRAREMRKTKIYPYAAVTQKLNGRDLTEMGLLHESGAVAFSDGNQAIADSLVMMRALSYARITGRPVMNHPEDPRLAQYGVMNKGELATRFGLGGISPVAEIVMLERDIALAHETGGRYHASHISTAQSVELIARAKDKGVNITCDTAPFYFSLTELDVTDYRTFCKLSPPLRSESDRRAIAQGLKDGIIDAIASDHRPEDQDAKRLPFAQAAYGAIGLETLLPVSLMMASEFDIPLPALIHKLSTAPAAILGLDNFGKLQKNAVADLIVFDPDHAWKLDAAQLKSKAKNTPYDERPMTGRVLYTMIDGRVVFRHPDTQIQTKAA